MVSVLPTDKVAKVRAHLLHILYELGKEDHEFRLRYNGEVLQDALALVDYDLSDNSVITMVPMGKSRNVSIIINIHKVTNTGVLTWITASK